MLNLAKKYRTRGDNEVLYLLHCPKNDAGNKIMGFVKYDDGSVGDGSWYEDGAFICSGKYDELDLVLATECDNIEDFEIIDTNNGVVEYTGDEPFGDIPDLSNNDPDSKTDDLAKAMKSFFE